MNIELLTNMTVRTNLFSRLHSDTINVNIAQGQPYTTQHLQASLHYQ